MTKKRQLILDIINGSYEHPTADAIFFEARKICPTIVMATVYNSLNALVDAGLIMRISVFGKADRYDRNIPHEHFICPCCGKLYDAKLNDLKQELEARLGRSIISYELNIRAVCDECKNK